MNEYNFVTSCKHEGTIKAVKSSSGKHAGKWICKVKGPKVTSMNIKVKTLYTAPFLGAAKASIAKFLCVTVATVEVTSSASGAQVISTPILAQQTIQSKKNSNANEFLRSAKLEADSIRQENERMTKETQEAKDLKVRLRGQIRAIREEQLKLQSDLESAKEQMEKSKNENLAEKSKLKGQIRALQEQRDELKCDIKSAVQKNDAAEKEKHEKELRKLGTEKSKLKGQIRALQELYDQLKSDIEAVSHKKNCAEKETQAALAKKEEYEGEAKTVKKALESHRFELASLAKGTKKNTAGESEPPTKKQKTGKRAKGGTIGKSMKATELKEEAVARGIDVKE